MKVKYQKGVQNAIEGNKDKQIKYIYQNLQNKLRLMMKLLLNIMNWLMSMM